MQVLATAASAGEGTYLPVGIDHIELFAASGAFAVSHAVLRPGSVLSDRPETLTADVFVYDPSGRPLAAVEGLHLKHADENTLLRLGRNDHHDELLYEVAWRLLDEQLEDRCAAEQFSAPDELVGVAATQIERLRDRHALHHYDGLLHELESLSTGYIVVALERLGLALRPGLRFTAGSLGVAARHRQLIDHLLQVLAEDAIIVPSADGWEVVRVPVVDIGEARWNKLLETYPLGHGELTLARRCGEQLAAALTGDADPLELLFPGGSLEHAEQMYQLSPYAHFYNSLAAEVVAAAAEQLVPGTRLRVLEIGAGTGGTTSYVLPRLPAGGVQYTYSDVSPHFLVRAREKFAEFGFVDYRVLDIESDLAAQGFDVGEGGGGPFDIVIAANVLHATADLRETFANVKRLLAPEGLVVMTEMVKPQRFISITFGLTEGWWKFIDRDVRPTSLLLGREQWLRFLDDAGFDQPRAVPMAPDQRSDALAMESVMTAQATSGRDTACGGAAPSGRASQLAHPR